MVTNLKDIKSAEDVHNISLASSCKKRRIEIVSFFQVAAIFTVIIACIINLSSGDDKSVLWSSLLSGSLGYLLPAPKIRRKDESLLPNSTFKQLDECIPSQHINELYYKTSSPDFLDGGVGSSFRGDQSSVHMASGTDWSREMDSRKENLA